MKKILILIVGIVLVQNLNGQSYTPFPTDTVQWNCLFWHQWSASDIHLFNSNYIQEGDTNLNGLTYNKVYYTETDDPLFEPQYIGGLREDSTKDIYFYPVSQNLPTPGPISFPNDTSEHLLYTFNNLDSGMVLPINTEFTEITVMGIDSVLLGDTYRKRYKIQQEGLFNYDYWIEGIGSNKDLFIPFTYEFEWDYYTLCFSDTETYYINSPNGEDSCHYWIPVGITENTIEKIYSYPNPASKSININFGSKNKNGIINIYNYQGRLIIQEKLVDSKLILDIEQIEPGVYIIEFNNENERQYTKFIKK